MKLNKFILGALTLFTLNSSWADPKLMGAWRSVDADKGALNGSMSFEAKGAKATLEADAQPVLVGTWQVTKPGTLKLTVADYGSSLMTYRFDKQRLVVTYDNGNSQTFEKFKANEKLKAKK